MRAARVRILIVALALAGSPAAAQIVDRTPRGDPLRVAEGKVSGRRLVSGVRAYLGLPFARPPVGALRWRAPQPPRPWTGVYNADRLSAACMQPRRGHDMNHYYGEEPQSEDCLHLNVWTPAGARPGAGLPVIVWIHGGGFVVGSAGMPIYDGAAIAASGAVFVSFNYRLGAFGFLSHPDLSAETPGRASGNYGLLDQIEALRWVRRNIRAFGGDPGNVTIAGQSAGAASVSLLQASPLARGLFHRLVAMSGAATVMGAAQSAAEAEAAGLRFQQDAGAASLAALRSLAADRVQAAAFQPRPVRDGALIADEVGEVFARRAQQDVPAMLGFTADEGLGPLSQVRSLAQYEEEARRLYGCRAAALLRLYPAADDRAARAAGGAAGRDAIFSAPLLRWARLQADHGTQPVFVYLFDRRHSYAPDLALSDHDPATAGAYHMADIPFWLGTLDGLNAVARRRVWSEADRSMARLMSSLLVAFARTGVPQGADARWPLFDPARPRVLRFAAGAAPADWPNGDRLAFFLAPRSAAGQEGCDG